jgi:hypothetical protein
LQPLCSAPWFYVDAIHFGPRACQVRSDLTSITSSGQLATGKWSRILCVRPDYFLSDFRRDCTILLAHPEQRPMTVCIAIRGHRGRLGPGPNRGCGADHALVPVSPQKDSRGRISGT